MEFTPESDEALGTWWDHSGDPYRLECIADVMHTINEDGWDRLHFDEFHVRMGRRRRIRSSASGLIVTVDLLIDGDQEFAHLVSIYELDEDDSEMDVWDVP